VLTPEVIGLSTTRSSCRAKPGSVTARIVIGAGSLGSTVLLRCRDLHGGLLGLSPMLGRNWSNSGTF
jgi:hypothetical protein